MSINDILNLQSNIYKEVKTVRLQKDSTFAKVTKYLWKINISDINEKYVGK